jgi:polyhydroxyalkanoate synthase
MHSFYLRSLYGRNELTRGKLELAGQTLSLADATQDAYMVGAINDHIVPWTSSDKAAGLLGGSVRYVLSSGGHIAGIVNPPGGKSWYETAEHNPADPARWRTGAQRDAGSWWEDWAACAGPRAGDLVARPRWARGATRRSGRRPATTSGADIQVAVDKLAKLDTIVSNITRVRRVQ